MSFLSTIGGLSAGLNGAVSAMERMGKQNLANEDVKWTREGRDRQRKQWTKDDKLEADLIDAANPPPDEASQAPQVEPIKDGGDASSQVPPDTSANQPKPAAPDASPLPEPAPKPAVPKLTGFGAAGSTTAPGNGVTDLARRQSAVYVKHGKARDAIQLLNDASTFERGNQDNQDRQDARTYQRSVGPLIEQHGGLGSPVALDAAARHALRLGQTEQWMGLTKQAHSMRWAESGLQLNQLEERYKSGNFSPQQAVEAVRDIYNSDIGAGKVESIEVDPSGKINMVAVNSITGQRVNKSFGSPSEMFKSLGDFYRSPEMKAAVIEQNQKLQFWKAQQDYKHGQNVEVANIRWGGDGTGSPGGKKKAPATPDEVASGLFMDAIKQTSAQQNVFTPVQINSGDTAARSAMSLNPGIKPEVAATAGMVFANAKPGSTVFGWDAATNSAVEQVQTPQGLVAVNRVTHRNAAARQMPPEKLKLAVESSISRLTGGDEAKRPKIIAAAFDSTGKARRALLDEAKTELMSMPQFKQLSPQGQAEAIKTHERNVDAALSVPLGWIRNFGQDLKQ